MAVMTRRRRPCEEHAAAPSASWTWARPAPKPASREAAIWLNPKGPCTQIVYTLAHRDYIKANVCTNWVHGPLGKAFSFCGRLSAYLLSREELHAFLQILALTSY